MPCLSGIWFCTMKKKIWYTYDDVHRVIKQLADKVKASGVQYDAMIAIGGGGFIPARILRCFLNIPIYAVTTAYYDGEHTGKVTDSVKKIQWLDPLPETLKGKNVLVVDEVDDSRVTLEFCLNEFAKEDFGTIGIAVLHEKIKEKKGKLPEGMPYFSGITVQDWWINYPWDADDIDEHNRLADQATID
ncbi:putative phosphoribosyltransferase [Neisseria zoodegmatis]|uniref:Phosphoribosyltransferase n=2 Tax=Neisseria zoodegmatis TaxID=326523 RepID=A0AB38DQE7_9NEIS|nr:putative phosphoribosyltransferase [Neisseria zoodegmatis]